MERERLGLLLGDAGGVGLLAREALREGAPYEVWPGCASRENLASIYRRRLRHTQRKGLATIGFAEAVTAIEAHPGDGIALGYVDFRESGGYYFQLFLTAARDAVVACLGVGRPLGR